MMSIEEFKARFSTEPRSSVDTQAFARVMYIAIGAKLLQLCGSNGLHTCNAFGIIAFQSQTPSPLDRG